MLWYSRANEGPEDVIAQILDKTPLVNWSVNTRASLEGHIAYAKREAHYRRHLPKLEQMLTDVTRIQNDPAAAAEILNKTQDGLLFTASYSIQGEDKRSSGWMIRANCTDR